MDILHLRMPSMFSTASTSRRPAQEIDSNDKESKVKSGSDVNSFESARPFLFRKSSQQNLLLFGIAT